MLSSLPLSRVDQGSVVAVYPKERGDGRIEVWGVDRGGLGLRGAGGDSIVQVHLGVARPSGGRGAE